MTTDRDDVVQSLKQLVELHRSGALTNAEFTAAKQCILGHDAAGSGDASTTADPSLSGRESPPSPEASQAGKPGGLPPSTPHPSTPASAEPIVEGLRARPRGALVGSVAVAVVLVGAVGWAVATSEGTGKEGAGPVDEAAGSLEEATGPVDEACQRLRTVTSGETGRVLRDGRRAEGEMNAQEFMRAVERRCPGVLDRARAPRPTPQRPPRASNEPTPAPPASPPPPTESIEQRRAREVQECIARGSDYRWTAANQCVFDPAPPPITGFSG